jgi:hypothetical protein
MTLPRRPLFALAVLPILLAVAGCGVGTPAPAPTGTATPTATASPSPSGTATPPGEGESPAPAPDPIEAAAIVVTGAGFRVVGDDGSVLVQGGYDDDAATVAAGFAEALGADPVVTTTTAAGTGCDADQTMYDFGGIVLRTPGYVGSVGSIEVDVDGSATTGGVPIETVGGMRVGAPQASALAALAPTAELYALGPLVVGYDRINPEADEFDGIGMLAEFDGGVLRRFIGIHYFYGDC